MAATKWLTDVHPESALDLASQIATNQKSTMDQSEINRNARGALDEHACHVDLTDCPYCDGLGLEGYAVKCGESRAAFVLPMKGEVFFVTRFCAECNGSGTLNPEPPARLGAHVSDPFADSVCRNTLVLGW